MLALIAILIVLIVVLAIAGWALWLILSAALVGAIIGGLARAVIPGRQDISILATVVLGWIGSLVGSLFGRHVFHVGSLLTILCEIGAAAILVGIASSPAGKSMMTRQS
ncbi:MAG: GlsB/YeaQ/YmgE family stress response membrane protein [Marmoricola sp.]